MRRLSELDPVRYSTIPGVSNSRQRTGLLWRKARTRPTEDGDMDEDMDPDVDGDGGGGGTGSGGALANAEGAGVGATWIGPDMVEPPVAGLSSTRAT